MDTATQFKLINDLIVAIGSLLWPIITLTIALVFRAEVAALLKRVRKGKILGQELELEPHISNFKREVNEAQQEVVDPTQREDQKSEEPEKKYINNEIFEAARVNPELGIIRLSGILEKEIRNLAGAVGVAPRSKMPITTIFNMLVSKGYIPNHTSNSLKIFWDLRNKIVHGESKEEKRNIIKVLDVGLVLLSTIKSIPHETHIVEQTGLDLYVDPEGRELLASAKGLWLRTISPGGSEIEMRIFATTNPSYYKIGKQVAWEWNMNNAWGETWYRDPRDGLVKQAWHSSAEFAGRHIEEI